MGWIEIGLFEWISPALGRSPEGSFDFAVLVDHGQADLKSRVSVRPQVVPVMEEAVVLDPGGGLLEEGNHDKGQEDNKDKDEDNDGSPFPVGLDW